MKIKSIKDEGVISHRIIRTFEELSRGFQARGASKSNADRLALQFTLALEGFSQQQSSETIDRLLPEEQHNDRGRSQNV